MAQRVNEELGNVLILGSGGREHAIYHHINRASKGQRRALVAPGNGGIPSVDILDCDVNAPLDIALRARQSRVRLIIPGSESFLAAGYVDTLTYQGLKVFGPTASATRLESSKAFGKGVFDKAGVPTAEYGVTSFYDEACGMIDKLWPCVIKADGLCAGKGVEVPKTIEEAKEAAWKMLKERIHGDAGTTIVIERRLHGREWSAMFLCDGKNAIPLKPARDFKRAYDGDRGPNTGGMGAIAGLPDISAQKWEWARECVALPILGEMKRRGSRFHGVLYIGFMETNDGSYVLEVNVRFGDPEIQVILALLETDIVPYLIASLTYDGLRDFPPLEFSSQVAVCIVSASREYPGKCEGGLLITDVGQDLPHSYLLHAGTKLTESGQLVTSGGRVANAIGIGNTYAEAHAWAKERGGLFYFSGGRRRDDIAKVEIERE